MTPDQDDFRRRAIRAALIVAGIAAAIGLVIGIFTAGAVYMSGLVPEDSPEPTVAEAEPDAEDSLPSPSLSPTPTRKESASPSSGTRPADRTRPSPSREPSPSRTRRPQRDQGITLRASASSVGSYGRVTLSGRYPGGNGTTLQVQRREGGSWAAFPTSATVDGGSFSTYVASGQPGPNRFRVVDPTSGKGSNVVVFTVS
jgi:hypothetical protein